MRMILCADGTVILPPAYRQGGIWLAICIYVCTHATALRLLALAGGAPVADAVATAAADAAAAC